MLDSASPLPDSEPSVSESVKCERYIIGQVVGRQGKTINEIQANTGAKVVIHDDDKTAQPHELVDISIEGLGDNVVMAKRTVESIIRRGRRPDYHGTNGTALRQQAKLHLIKRDELFKEADRLEFEGNKGEAGRLRGEASAVNKAMHAAHMNAAKAIYNHNNDVDGEVDLHGLFVSEAADCFKAALEEHSPGVPLTIVTGAGHHSGNRRVAVKPKIVEMLNDARLPWRELSDGVLLVNPCSVSVPQGQGGVSVPQGG